MLAELSSDVLPKIHLVAPSPCLYSAADDLDANCSPELNKDPFLPLLSETTICHKSCHLKSCTRCTQSLPLLRCKRPWCQLLCWVCWLSSTGSRYRPDRSLLLQSPHQIRSPNCQTTFPKYEGHSLMYTWFQIPNTKRPWSWRPPAPSAWPVTAAAGRALALQWV